MNVAQLISGIRRGYLTQGRIEVRNKLAAAIDDTDTLLTFQYDLGQLQASSLISIGLEDMHVWSANGTSKTAEVDRGCDSTTAVAHPIGALVRVQPRWTDSQILAAANAELANLAAQGLYRVGVTTATFRGSQAGYELDADARTVVMVQAEAPSGDDWVRIDGWEQRHDQAFTSGVALFLRGQGGFEGRPLRITWRGGFSELTDLSDDVTDSGLPATAVDVLSMGAAINLLIGREVAQRFYETQGSTRRGEENPPGAAAQSFTPIIRRYQERLAAEKRALARKYGT